MTILSHPSLTIVIQLPSVLLGLTGGENCEISLLEVSHLAGPMLQTFPLAVLEETPVSWGSIISVV